MRVIPKSPTEKIRFFQARVAKWAENYALIGLDAGEVADIEAKLLAAREARQAQVNAQQKALAATQAFHNAADALAKAGGNAVLKVRAKAETTDDAQVYFRALLPRPKQASPVAAPGKPTQFAVQLDAIGQVHLRWKCKNPANAEGTVYEVFRSIDRGPMVYLAVVGKKKFTDETLPAGAASATYRVTALRSTKRGPAAFHMVHFGVTGGGGSVNSAMTRAA
jgi:hypothetical protein